MSDKTSVGDRMKRYENIPRAYLTPRMPIIVRVDGKAFHSYTKGFVKPWDHYLQAAMTQTAKGLIDEMSGVDFAYIQSDEISLVMNTYKRFSTSAWFDGNVQKIASVSASIASAWFNDNIQYQSDVFKFQIPEKLALFDARCFVIPKEEVVNYFHWRQIDAVRNSISGFAQANFSHKELHKKNTRDMKEMLLGLGLDWSKDISKKNQRGWCVSRQKRDPGDFDFDQVVRTEIVEDYEIPLFSKNREYIEKFLVQEEV